jgi:hypothetical protein
MILSIYGTEHWLAGGILGIGLASKTWQSHGPPSTQCRLALRDLARKGRKTLLFLKKKKQKDFYFFDFCNRFFRRLARW